MSHQADDSNASWKEGWRQGWKDGWAEGRQEGLGQGRHVELKAPIINGAVDGFIPYEELLNGLTVSMDVEGFLENELVRIFIPTYPLQPGELVLSARLIVTRGAIDSGFLVHGFNEDDVRQFAGRSIEVYFTRMTLFPVPESPRSRYLVAAPPARIAGHAGR